MTYRWTTWPLVAGVWAYRLTLGPLLGGRCRFIPSCSQYALDALAQYGAARGGLLAARRVCRCHPWGGSGFDPVPATHPEQETNST